MKINMSPVLDNSRCIMSPLRNLHALCDKKHWSSLVEPLSFHGMHRRLGRGWFANRQLLLGIPDDSPADPHAFREGGGGRDVFVCAVRAEERLGFASSEEGEMMSVGKRCPYFGLDIGRAGAVAGGDAGVEVSGVLYAQGVGEGIGSFGVYPVLKLVLFLGSEDVC
jgi:hypothetical protein